MNYLAGKTVLITGGAGFIGYHLAKKLLDESTCKIIIVDNLNDYYRVDLKKDRLKDLGVDPSSVDTHKTSRIVFYKANIADTQAMHTLFGEHEINVVVNLAAQAGVRYAKKNPRAYVESNIDGFFNIMQQSADHNVDICLYASSSSVYGNTTPIPFKETADGLMPLSFYAATKLSGELMACAYSQATSLHCVGLRFFNVYGPWGRPDMAYYSWSTAIRDKLPLAIHGQGKMLRDMTYIDDVTEAMFRLMEHYAPMRSPINPKGIYNNHEIFNIGNSSPVIIQDVFDYLNKKIGPSEQTAYVEKGADEADKTYADTSKLRRAIGFAPDTSMQDGLEKFVDWFKHYK